MTDTRSEDTASAIQALSGVFSKSMMELTVASNDHMLAISGTAALVACMPDTLNVAPERIAAVINLLAQGRSDAEVYRQKLARFVGMIMATARRLHDADAAKVPAPME